MATKANPSRFRRLWAGFLALAGLAILPLSGRSLPGQAGNGPPWKLIWSDEFEGSGAVDPARWLIDTGTSYPGGPANWGTGEVQTYTDRQDNVFVEGGSLHIRALHSGPDPLSGWTSARIETVRTDFQAPPGGGLAVEARLQLPDLSGTQAQGYWPAFWLLGAPYRGNYWNWPGVGEIDILENINGLNQWWSAMHCGTNPGGECNEPSGIGATFSGFAPSLQEATHTYRLEFDRSLSPEQLRWYVDGGLRFSLDANQVSPATWEAATDHGFFILLNLAIGGDWAGPPSAATASGGTLLVDYVRVYAWPVGEVYLPLVNKD